MNTKDIKTWNNQKLIDAHNNNQDFYPFNTIDLARIEAELLSRLERGENAIKACEEIREIYAGMDGFIPETCPEGYQQRIIKQMYDAAVRGIK